MSAFLHSTDHHSLTVARAIVRANNDPENMGRIKVEYPWFHGNTAQIPSEWARVCSPYASKQSGSWFVPEVGDEVLVFFENGNLDSPIVMGALYNPKNKPPTGEGSGDLKFIKTKAGHLLCFDDSDSDNGITLKSFDHTVSLKKDEVSIEHKGGAKIVLKDGEVTIQSAGKINIGDGAAHPLIFGDLFQQIFNAHTHGTAVGTSSPPATPMTPDMLSQKVKTV